VTRWLVTGAAGHVGAATVRLLRGRGEEVAALLRPASDPWRIAEDLPGLRVIRGGMEDLAAAEPAIAAFAPEAVLHLAWSGVSRQRRDDPATARANIDGSLATVECAARAGARVWIGLGSQAEHGEGGLLQDDSPLRPRTLYGASKAAVGLASAALCAAFGIRHCWLRLLTSYGPRDDPAHLVPQVTTALLRGERPRTTAGEQRWDFLHVDDVAAALVAAAEAETCSGAYVLGSGGAVEVRELVRRIEAAVGVERRAMIGALPYPPDVAMLLQADPRRLRADAGWEPRIALDEGIARTVDWYRANLARYAA
jgi:nucleoside-diphosphate-sugar epimerase